MSAKIGCDMHKKYSVFSKIDENGVISDSSKVYHNNGQLEQFLDNLPDGSEVAVEACGGWYKVIDAMEEAGLNPKLTNPHKAKLMMGNVDKTDKLDAEGLALLLANGTLPEVSIPTKEIRDKRELLRCRMYLVGKRTSLKNRIHATLDKYGLKISAEDLFGKSGQKELQDRLNELPSQHQFTTKLQLELINRITEKVEKITERAQKVLEDSSKIKKLKTIPGVGSILSAVIKLEVGEVQRFARAKNLASYSGTVPRINASGGNVKHGKTKKNVNHYLKWAYAEAANTVSAYSQKWADRHVGDLYNRLCEKKNHGIAVGAVSRHLAVATWHILTKEVAYKDPKTGKTLG